MGLQSRRYSDTQRDALLRAVVIDGLAITEARRRAVAGELPDVAAFAIPYGSAKEIVRRGRDEYELRALRDPAQARATLDDDALRLAGFAHMATKAIEAAVKNGETPDPGAVKRAADALVAARRALPPEPPKPKPPADEHDSATPSTDDVLAALLAQAPNGAAQPRAEAEFTANGRHTATGGAA